ncbi:hypothetical protein E3J84_05020 [Candidatus Aerophobetes bacterium]|uniref:HepT-like domain-containing protein n=1 Tax=Aerophobetes bacterium TaxID=2030807 RepID=A0A523RUX0_UNCAE|nr:MAG: hypothetical protein E3J84_05020 [Candidatus Aerophobetes bacterium]
MKEEYKELREDVLDEEEAIEETLERLSKVMSKFDFHKENYSTEPAMGTYLMNFYNGIENILKRITKKYYLTLLKGGSWHKELLALSFNPPPGKIAVFNQNIVQRLHPYRNFRHRFVSGYGFQLRGEKMLELIDNIDLLWSDIKKTISDFWDKL